jgi:emfourin
VRIDFRIDGGLAAFPGLAKPVTIDCDRLPPQTSARLRDLVRRADFFERRPHQAPAMPDARVYTIAVDDGAQCRTMSVPEPIADPALRELVHELCQHAADVRRAR